MKTLLVLCGLVAAVYCDSSSIVVNGKCIGIQHNIPPYNGGCYISRGSFLRSEVCCDQVFNANTQMTGFKATLQRNEIQAVFDANYNKLIEGKTNCRRRGAGGPLWR